MAHINTFSTLWYSGSNSPYVYDARPYGVLSYTQDKVNNKTTYTLDMYLQIAKIDGGLSSVSYNFNSNISGTVKNYFGSVNVSGVGSWGTVHLGTQIYIVNHNSNGSGNQISYTINGAVNFFINGSWSSWRPTLYTITYYHTAPTIPRVSTVTNNTSASNRKLFGEEITFNIDRKSSSFTHDLRVSLGTEASIDVGTNVGASCIFTFPEQAIRFWKTTDIPNITVTCTTKNGNTIIGTSTTTVYLEVPDSYVPTLSLSITDLGSMPPGKVPELFVDYIKGQSSILGHITAEGIEGSTIKSCSVDVIGAGINQKFATTDFGESFRFYTNLLSEAGDLNIYVYVTDSRNRIAEYNLVVNVLDWHNPKLVSYKIQRCDQDGTSNEEGTYGKIVAQYDISPLNNRNYELKLKVNLGETMVQYDLDTYSGTFESATYDFQDLAINSNYNFDFYISDHFAEIPYVYNLTPSYVTRSLLAGGKGITFGRIATEEGLHSYMDAYFHNKVEGIYSVGDIFLTFNQNNPADKFGGVWELVAKGKTLVGVNSEDDDFDTVEKTGGSKYLQKHRHHLAGTQFNQSGNNNTIWVTRNQAVNWDITDQEANYAGTGDSGNLQPYITCYIWKKIA